MPPGKPMNSKELDEWTDGLLDRLDFPRTVWRSNFFSEWARWEATGAHYNPLATTWSDTTLENPNDPHWNTFIGSDGRTYHVKNYRTLAAGVEATALTLKLKYYYPIIDTLATQRIQAPEPVARAVRVWGTTGFANRIESGWTPSPGPGDQQPPDDHGPTIEQRVGALEYHLARLNEGTLARFATLYSAFEGSAEAAIRADALAAAAADPSTIPTPPQGDQR